MDRAVKSGSSESSSATSESGRCRRSSGKRFGASASPAFAVRAPARQPSRTAGLPSRSARRARRLGGEGVVPKTRLHKGLAEGAGENGPLTQKGFFVLSPHRKNGPPKRPAIFLHPVRGLLRHVTEKPNSGFRKTRVQSRPCRPAASLPVWRIQAS